MLVDDPFEKVPVLTEFVFDSSSGSRCTALKIKDDVVVDGKGDPMQVNAVVVKDDKKENGELIYVSPYRVVRCNLQVPSGC